ncbi:hypothetical protein NAL32_21640 [Chryseobacterium sp. Ch-15]|uniref:Uncharacterized protein n=1 Tax=Chryseobacterium muglaense TaxID=2893752 RepID=A0A9Q3UQ92_9FLAO|nr:hypothetical protein [Chryseobacterium muglaense]MBD3907109.1 hypothetical protein [Chryseobacterium muglaense]MCC9033124.1 hypothetical protein [Chryseobacterium muglaense]MCM2556993.1 hypothetical protein [Chryseobacterium muglaense]
MKLTLDQLRVDSYATQLSETELTEVKGGTTPGCAWLGYAAVAAAVTAVAAVVVKVIDADNDHKECGTKTWTDSKGVKHTEHVCRE